MTTTRAADKYSPLYFLASVGAGGIAVTFFIYLLFWVPHKGRAVPNFEDIMAVWPTAGAPLKFAIGLAMVSIAVFALLNLQKLFWSISAYNGWKKTPAFEQLRNSNAETTLAAFPLALAMTVNVMFIVGLVFVPKLWTVVEYLFPLALAAFTLIGIFAFSIIGDFLGRVLSKGGMFDVTAHNSFAQMLPTFALAMVAVGLAAPAAMSGNAVTVTVSLILSTFFGVTAIVYGLLALVTAFNSMLHYGTSEEAAPTLMVVIPILTVLSIMFMRQDHALHTQFEVHSTAAETMTFLAQVLSIQFIFLGLGLLILRRQGYFKDFVFGNKTSPGSYALVCPGVALSVLLQFFVNKGLVASGVIDKFSVAYWAITAIAIAYQFAMIWLVVRLNGQHFGKQANEALVAAE